MMAPRWYIYFAVIVSGAAVLAVEIVATRLIGPFYGAGLYLWSAMIGVTLGALSVGYRLGGRLADSRPVLGWFCALPGGAGIWIALVPWVLRPMLSVTEPLGLRGAVLVSAVLLFFPPLVLLGMVSPFAVRLRTASVEVVGRRAGELYALTTIAGVAAALGTGFVLIPAAGSGRIAFLVGLSLVVAALVGAALAKSRTIPALATIAAAVAAGIVLDPGQREDPDAGLLDIVHSPYAEIRVVEVEDLRIMLIDGAIHTEADAATLESRSPYVDVLELAGEFFEKPGRMLLVGLGGGSVVKRYVSRGWTVDAVEIDPAVTRVARSHFGLEPSDARVFHMDGREFLLRHETLYDLVIVDAFGSSSIPYHLVTEEAFVLLGKRLATHGVIAINVIASGWHDEIVHALAATLGSVFGSVIALPMAEPPNRLGNLILLASYRELELLDEPPVPPDRFSPEYNRAHAWDNRFEVNPTGIRVLTDDRNPVDIWAERINLENRKALHDYFGRGGVGW